MIPVQEYFENALQFSEAEQRIREEVRDWLPKEVIDAHTHCGCAEHVIGLDPAIQAHMMSTYPWFTLEMSDRCRAALYGSIEVRSLRFAMAPGGIDHRSTNEYLLTNTRDSERIAVYGIPDDVDYTLGILRHRRASALKMYHQYFSPAATEIYTFFPPAVLRLAEERGIPIILHLPRMITKCGDQLHQLMRDFPRLRVVLAHLGLPHLPVPGLRETYEEFARYPNLHMDTAMIPSPEVVGMAIGAFGYERILFGSDEPLNLIRATVFDHPEKGQRLEAPYPYHWLDPEDHKRFGHLAADAVHMHWDQLRAIRAAVDTVVPEEQRAVAIRAIFHDNSVRVYGF